MYEIIMSLLAVAAVGIALLDIAGQIVIEGWLYYVELAIWLIFVADYVVRFIRAENKLKYIRSNVFELISILPFSSFLRVFRMTRLLRVTKLARVAKVSKMVRFAAFMGRVSKRVNGFLHTNGLIYVLYTAAVLIFLGAIGIYVMEKGTTVNNFSDAIWWSLVTTTTVGYGDIAPITGIGRVIAVVLMLVGIGAIGMLTSTLATYFMTDKKTTISDQDTTSEDLHAKIDRLSPEQRKIVDDLLESWLGK